MNIKSSILLLKAVTSEFPARRWFNVKLPVKVLQQLFGNFLTAYTSICFLATCYYLCVVLGCVVNQKITLLK